MARGIAETHGWGVDEIACYLQARPGIGEQWDQQSLEALLRDRLPRPRARWTIDHRHPATAPVTVEP